jgi:predicted RND superfamily exporter protein
MLTHSDNELWLQGSHEHAKLSASDYRKSYVQKLRIVLEGDDPISRDNIAKLRALHSSLESIEGVQKIESALTHTFVNSVVGEEDDSELVEISQIIDNDIPTIIAELKKNHVQLAPFFSDDHKKMYFFVISKTPLDLTIVDIPFEYDVVQENEQQNSFKDMILFSMLFSILFILFSIAFRSIIPSVLGTIFVAFTTLFTIAIYHYIQPNVELHVSILLIAITVSLMDFVYIYYGWHILQKHHTNQWAIYHAMAKTIIPIFWTTVVSIVGIGSLIFQDSLILQSIGYNVIISSSVGFILSFSLLTGLLSFFKVKKPYIITKNSSRFFAQQEAHYERSLLQAFLFFTASAFLFSLVYMLFQPLNLSQKKDDRVIQLIMKGDGFTQQSLARLKYLHDGLEENFPNEIEQIVSTYGYVYNLYKQQNPQTPFIISDVDAESFAFELDLYGISDQVMKKGDHKITLYIKKDTANKNDIIHWIRTHDSHKKLLFDDVDSLLSAAKYDTISNMIFVIVFIVMLIVFIMFFLTKDKRFALIALIVNISPLAWFFAFLVIVKIPLSTEILVAMLIMVALSSDATIHFLYFYHRNIKKHLSNARSLEISFINVGTPIGLGNVILGLTFILLIFVNIPTISTIGLYSTVLIMMSLFTDLFVLPVLFIEIIKSKMPNVAKPKLPKR